MSYCNPVIPRFFCIWIDVRDIFCPFIYAFVIVSGTGEVCCNSKMWGFVMHGVSGFKHSLYRACEEEHKGVSRSCLGLWTDSICHALLWVNTLSLFPLNRYTLMCIFSRLNTEIEVYIEKLVTDNWVSEHRDLILATLCEQKFEPPSCWHNVFIDFTFKLICLNVSFCLKISSIIYKTRQALSVQTKTSYQHLLKLLGKHVA